MTSTKRLFAAFLAFVFLFSVVPVSVFAVETPPVQIGGGGSGSGSSGSEEETPDSAEFSGVTYTLNWEKKTASVSDFDQSADSVTVPSVIIVEEETFTVVSVADSAFAECTQLVSVVLPDSVTSIGAGAFSDCYVLQELTVSPQLSFIGADALENTLFLSHSADGLLILGQVAYSFIGEITGRVIIPDSVTYLAQGAFSERALFSVVFSNEECVIHEDAFFACTDVIVFGAIGSTAAESAISNGFEFFAIPSMTWASLPQKTEYYEGEELELSDASFYYVDANNAGEALSPIPVSQSMISGYHPLQIGEQTVTVTWEGLSLEFSVEVKPKAVTGIFILEHPKQNYKIGDALDLTGGKIALVYNNNNQDYTEMDMEDAVVTGFDSSAVGDYTLTVTYDETFTAQFVIHVSAVQVERIEVLTPPDDLTCLEGKQLNLSGGTIKVYFDNNTDTELPLSEEMISGFNPFGVGEQTLTVSYGGVDADTGITVTVIAKSVVSIEITTLPDKTEYYAGEELTMTGGKLTVTYNNDTHDEIRITSLMVTGFETDMVGEQTLTVNYEGASDTFRVVVKALVVGDLNDDGVVDQKDAIYLLYRTFMPEAYPVNQNVDFNGDGVVSDRDVIYLLTGESGDEGAGGSTGGLVPGGGTDAPPAGNLPISEQSTPTATQTYQTADTPSVKLNLNQLSISKGSSVTATLSLENCPAFTSALVEIRVGSNLQVVSAQWLSRSFLDDYRIDSLYGAMVFENAATVGNLFSFAVKGNAITSADEVSVTVILHNAANELVAQLTDSVNLEVVETSVQRGDLNGVDGVTDADAVYLLFYTYFPDDYPINQTCDYNGDGSVTDADAVYLLFFTYFPDDYPLHA